MAHSGTRILAPVDQLGDVGAVLGTNSGDAGTNARSSRVNWKAKNKPYRSGLLDTLPDATKGDSPYNYGMSWPQFGSPSAPNASGLYLFTPYESDPASSARAAMNGWQYLQPRGLNSPDGNEAYRDGDFIGYYGAATEPLIIQPGQIQASTALTTVATIGALHKETFDPGEIDFSTMVAVKNYYFCLVGYRLVGDPDPQTYFVVSNSARISSGDFAADITFSGSNFPSSRLGTWYIYPCLCSVGGINFFAAAGQSLPSAQYIPLPCTKRWQAFVEVNQRNAILKAEKLSSTSIKYRLVINNDSSGAYTFNGVQVWLVHNSTVPPATLEYDERAYDIDNTGTTGQVSVAAHDSYDTGWVTVTGLPSSLVADVTLYATCSAGFSKVGPIMPLYPN